jgi:hypothetical protein
MHYAFSQCTITTSVAVVGFAAAETSQHCALDLEVELSLGTVRYIRLKIRILC